MAEYHQLQERFDEVISELPAYGSSLAKIKFTYESVMKKIEDCRRVRSMVKLQEEQRSLLPSTLRNFIIRKQELELKLNTLKAENTRLKESLKNKREMQEMMRKKKEQEREAARSKARMNSGRRRRLNLTIEQATDLTLLDRELKRVERELEDIRMATERRHVPLSKKMSLQIQLQDREKRKSKLERENRYLGYLYLELSLGLKAAESYYSVLKSRGTMNYSMADGVLESINRIDNSQVDAFMEEFNKEDPDEEREAEFLLHCAEKFNELFDSDRYEEAALLAASSPKGSLRTIETLEKFKEVSANICQGRSHPPLLLYCKALMQSASVFPAVSDREAMECVVCALECQEYDQLMHWVASGSLPLNKETALLVSQKCCCERKQCDCRCCEIALIMFEKLGPPCAFELATCMAKMGRYTALLTLIEEKRFQRRDIISLLYAHPAKEFAYHLVCPPPPHTPLCDIFEVMFILAQSKEFAACEKVLSEYSIHYSVGVEKVLDNANRNPAYSELMQNLARLLSGTQLHWMVLDILASKTVLQATNDVLNEIQDAHQGSITQESQSLTSTTVEDEEQEMAEETSYEHKEDLEQQHPKLVARSGLGQVDENYSASSSDELTGYSGSEEGDSTSSISYDTD